MRWDAEELPSGLFIARPPVVGFVPRPFETFDLDLEPEDEEDYPEEAVEVLAAAVGEWVAAEWPDEEEGGDGDGFRGPGRTFMRP